MTFERFKMKAVGYTTVLEWMIFFVFMVPCFVLAFALFCLASLTHQFRWCILSGAECHRLLWLLVMPKDWLEEFWKFLRDLVKRED